MRKRIGFVALLAMLLLAAMALPAIARGHIFQANLTTGAEVHEVAASNATGHATFTVTDEGIEFTLKANRLTGPAWGAHIHGPAGTDANAGIVARLCGLPPVAPAPECTTDDNGKLRVGGLITQENLSDGWTMESLIELLESGNSYVNVHTDLNPPGEIRGQVR
ncbi:MAG: CHRD domain-containing protein [Acidimicrobiia bacterium]|nr:CHRD domain-containing protein [Acidimicrobiia bacterium]